MTAVLVAVASAVAIAACGSQGGSGSSTAGAKDAVKVSMLNSGSRSDSSWTQSWAQGAVQAQAARPDSKVSYVDQLNSVDALQRAGGAALTEGAKAVIFATSQVPEALDTLGRSFPKAWVCEVQEPRKSYGPNMCTILPEFEDGAFLAGVTAGLATKTDHVGVVGAFDAPTLTNQMEAFALGARYINPSIKVERAYTQSLIDPAKARAAAAAQYAAGADIVLSAVDDAVRGIYSAARDHHGLVITQYTDQYTSAPDVVLTSVLYHLDEIGKIMIQHAIDGDLEARSYNFSLKDGPYGVLAPFRGAPAKALSAADRKRIETITAQVKSGEIKVPPLAIIGVAGSGSKVDPKTLGGTPG